MFTTQSGWKWKRADKLCTHFKTFAVTFSIISTIIIDNWAVDHSVWFYYFFFWCSSFCSGKQCYTLSWFCNFVKCFLGKNKTKQNQGSGVSVDLLLGETFSAGDGFHFLTLHKGRVRGIQKYSVKKISPKWILMDNESYGLKAGKTSENGYQSPLRRCILSFKCSSGHSFLEQSYEKNSSPLFQIFFLS